jgi:CheY-like chemotaxis protein
VILAFSVLFPLVQAIEGADPYAAALDKRFEPTPAETQSRASGTATFEQGLKNQIREMSHRPEPVAPPAENGVEPWLVLASVMVGALALSLITLVGLRRWNQWLDREAAKRLSALADDPLMAEFLRLLREVPQDMPEPAQMEPGSPRAGSKPEQKAQTVPAADPVPPAIAVIRETIEALRADFQSLSRASDDAGRQKILQEVLGRVGKIKESAAPEALRLVRLLASAVHGLLNQLSIKTANITSSSVRTAVTAIDLMDVVCTRFPRPDLITAPPVRLLAVDDDAISRRAVSLALKKAFNDPDLAPEGRIALALARQQPYDVIFLDIEMPVMDGFELYSKIRQTAPNCVTPIVFVTSHTDFDSRAKSALLGANELIGKPFLAFEISVKALTLVIKARQAQENASAQKGTEKGRIDVPAEDAAADLPFAVSRQNTPAGKAD